MEQGTPGTPAIAPPSGPAATPRRWWLLPVALLLAAGLPLGIDSAVTLTVLAQAATLAVVMLSFNLLYGQTGLMSFGHAVYAGLGGLVAAHAMRLAVAGGWGLPLPLVPLAGGLGGLAAALVFGHVSTRLAGTGFAMITLAIGELMVAAAAVLPGFFGGEAGVRVDRTLLPAGIGWGDWSVDFGAQRAVVSLIAVWSVLCGAALRIVARSPPGLLALAVRDNPDRVAMLGSDPAAVRYRMMLIAGFFAGIGGALGVLHFEIANAESLGPARSGAILLFTFLGGSGSFWGPVAGAVLHALALTILSEWTRAWLLYLGLFFLVMVLVAPRGLAGVAGDLRNGRCRVLRQPGRGPAIARGLAILIALTAAVVMIEMAWRLRFDQGAPLVLAGWAIASDAVLSWVLAAGVGALAVLGAVAPGGPRARTASGERP